MDHSLRNDRYQRQISLKELGESGQRKLQQARVLVIGAGGLGCPALQYLVGAGVGTIGIADHDVISLNNLHRQVLYSTDDVGLAKALRASDILRKLNPEIHIIAYNERMSNENTLGILSDFDIIVDGTDNFSTRYMINDACIIMDKPLVYGAISRFEGQLAIFNCRKTKGISPVNYRDLFPQPPKDGEIQNCEEAGVLGVLPGIIGTMMANETIKLITGIGDPLINRLLTYNSLNNQMYELELQAKQETRSLIPADAAEFNHCNYDLLCSSELQFELDSVLFDRMLNDRNIDIIDIIDVREIGEMPLITEFEHTQIPLSQFRDKMSSIPSDTVVIFCQTGKRSSTAAKVLADQYGNSKKIYSLKGGIMNWKKLKHA